MIKWRLYSLYISGALHFVLVISIPLHSLWLKVLEVGDGIRNNDIQLLCVDGDTYPCLNRSDGLAYIYWQKRPQDWNDHKYHGHPLLQLFYQEHDLKDIDLCSRSLQLIQRYNVSCHKHVDIFKISSSDKNHDISQVLWDLVQTWGVYYFTTNVKDCLYHWPLVIQNGEELRSLHIDIIGVGKGMCIMIFNSTIHVLWESCITFYYGFLSFFIIAESPYEWLKIVIHGNECIISFLTRYFMSWTHKSAKNYHRALISPLLPRAVFSDIELGRHHNWSVTSREREILVSWRHIRRLSLHAQIGTKAIFANE